MSHIQPTHQQSLMVNERQSQNSITSCELAALNKNDQQKESTSADTDKGQSDHKARVSEESHKPSENLESMSTARKMPQKHVLHIYRK